jgi:hypothetical protein
MDNNFLDDEDTDEIPEDDGEDFDAEFIFGEPIVAGSSDESNAGNDTNSSMPSIESNSRNPSESASAINFNADETKLLNEFSRDAHSKVGYQKKRIYHNLKKSLTNFSTKKKLLLSKAGTGDLKTCLNNHWRNFVPICFNALDVPTRNLIDTDSNKILLKPLESYICNDLDSDKVLSKLIELDDPPVLCGKVFKAGEPSYFCRYFNY